MGTTGTGKFSDYPGGSKKKGKGGSDIGGGGGSQDDPEKGDQNKCGKAIGGISLEDVARGDFYKRNKKVPPTGTEVLLREHLEKGRLVIEAKGGEIIGSLPTRYNYLRQCMEQGNRYGGNVISSSSSPLPTVKIDLGPLK
jgi:hypothetical protein